MTAERLPEPPARPGARKPDPRKRRTLNREAIVDVALEIVDEDGLEGLSMRRVAERLETGPASLYAHVANKDELTELVYDRVVGEVQVPEPDKRRWEEQLADALRQLYEVLVTHRDIAFVSMARIPLGPNTLRVAEGMLAILRAGGVSDRVAGMTLDFASLAVNSLAYEQSLYPRDATEEEIHEYYEQVSKYFASLPADRFPHLSSMAGSMTDPEPDERLDFSFDVLVQGVAALARGGKRRR
jgi:AcrR family transcriptional regulator